MLLRYNAGRYWVDILIPRWRNRKEGVTGLKLVQKLKALESSDSRHCVLSQSGRISTFKTHLVKGWSPTALGGPTSIAALGAAQGAALTACKLHAVDRKSVV